MKARHRDGLVTRKQGESTMTGKTNTQTWRSPLETEGQRSTHNDSQTHTGIKAERWEPGLNKSHTEQMSRASHSPTKSIQVGCGANLPVTGSSLPLTG